MRAEAEAEVTARWLAGSEKALASGASLEKLFERDSYWRDVLALTWRIGTVSGAATVAAELSRHAASARPRSFERDSQRTPPRRVQRGGRDCIEAIFRFETAEGEGEGVVRFLPGSEKAWTLLTALEDLKEKHGAAGGQEPTVLIVGGGHAGLSIAARLKKRGIDALIVDRWPRVGDNWRQRYGVLKLHNQIYVNHLPYLRYPDDFPAYIPKDLLA